MKLKPFFAELFATYCFMVIVVGTLLSAQMPGSALGSLGVALAHGFGIAALVAATLHISGGHLNPAITIAVWLGNRITLTQAVFHIVGQVVGAYLAVLTWEWGVAVARMEDISYAVPRLGPAIGPWPGLVFEVILTFVLGLVVFGTILDRRAAKMSGLYVGLVIAVAMLTIGPMTGASLNPARYLGPALVSGNLSELTVYLGGPVIGAAAAALVYTYGFGKPDPEASAE